MKYTSEPDYKRLFLAIFLAAIVLVGWQALVEWPRRQLLAKNEVVKAQKRIEEKVQYARTTAPDATEAPMLTREQHMAASPRLAIASDKLDGSIALKGARFDDLKLAQYRVTMEPDSPEVTLLSPGGEDAYFAQAGWVSPEGGTRVPDAQSLWQSDRKVLTPGQAATLRWDNGEGVAFILTVSLDNDYMFTIGQRVENRGNHPVSVIPYAYINRAYVESAGHYGIMHEGPIGVMENALEEIGYETLREKGNKIFENASGWLGITDKYWQTALIPGQGSYKVTFSHYNKGGRDRYQADYLGQPVSAPPGGSAETSVRFFAGAKEINVLDDYANGDRSHAPIPLFDRAVDFGSLYFMTKPMFLTLNFVYSHIGNFGIAIMLLTIVVKLLMYPLANKSYKSMAQMRAVQPQMLKIRERYVDDQIAMNKEMMALYKREKINPAAGCLPILIQMPVFFALYKVLYVTIEMRHAPFFWWIKDLSATDPSNIFTLFGLVEWGPPAWLHLSVLPMLFCATMVIQMKQQPKPADPVQAKMMAFMPYFFLFIFAGFPAGLVLYWVWSNMLSILQQHVISKRHGKPPAPAKAAA